MRLRNACISALLLVAGCGSETGASPELKGVQLDLPTSTWESGDDMMFALLTGVVRVDARDCVFLWVAESETRMVPVWPKGFTAYRADDGVTLYDSTGRVAAHEGDVIQSGGGYIPLNDTMSASKCLPNKGDVAAIQGEVEVVSK